MALGSIALAARRGWAQTFGRHQLLLPLPAAPLRVQACLRSTERVPAARLPYRVKVSAEKRYAWCACGHSQKQPFCDGAHKSKAPSVSPLRFSPEKSKAVMLCACKETRNPPYCDGSHFKVIFRDIKKSVKGLF